MKILLLTILACLAFAAGYAEKPVKGAHLRLENATYNFGDVPRKGGDLVREFRFVNDGTAPLVLVRVITSCSCLKASFSKRPVEPADSQKCLVATGQSTRSGSGRSFEPNTRPGKRNQEFERSQQSDQTADRLVWKDSGRIITNYITLI